MPSIAGLHDDLVAAIEQHERAVADEVELAVVCATDQLGGDRLRIRGVTERPDPANT